MKIFPEKPSQIDHYPFSFSWTRNVCQPVKSSLTILDEFKKIFIHPVYGL